MSDIFVFISSCMDELHNERASVRQGLKALDFRSFAFERNAGPDPYPVREVWQDALKESKIYIGIFYRKYGKYTIEEFQQARSDGLPCFVYVCNYHTNPVGYVDRDPKLQSFLDGLNNVADLTIGAFKYAHELEKKVIRDLTRWLYRHEQKTRTELEEALRKLALAQAELAVAMIELEAANEHSRALVAEIEGLKGQLAEVEVSARTERQGLERQISKLMSQQRSEQQQLMTLGETAEQLKSIVAFRTERAIGNLLASRTSERYLLFASELFSPEYGSKSTLQWIVSLSGSKLAEAYTLIQLGDDRYTLGDFINAIRWYEAAASIASTSGYHDLRLLVWLRIANAWSWVPDAKLVIEQASLALAQANRLNNNHYKAEATLYLIKALGAIDLRHRWREMYPMLIEGMQKAGILKDYPLQVDYLICLGECAARMHELDKAYAYLQDALNILLLESGRREDCYCRIYQSLSELMLERGDSSEAVRYIEMAVGVAQESKRPYFVASAQLTLARGKHAQGAYSEALHLVEEILPQTRQMGWTGVEQEAEYLRGELERELGHPDVAEIATRQAMKLAQEMKLKEEEVECLLSLGQILVALRRLEEARETLKQARRLSQERDYEDHFKKVEELLQSLSQGGEKA